MDDFLHHLEHLGIYSVLIWQSVLGVWIVTRWYAKNVTRSPNIIQQTLPTQIVGGEEHSPKGPVGVVDVDVKKHINITSADVSDLSSDEEIKGKVKTQKDKLKELRRG